MLETAEFIFVTAVILFCARRIRGSYFVTAVAGGCIFFQYVYKIIGPVGSSHRESCAALQEGFESREIVAQYFLQFLFVVVLAIRVIVLDVPDLLVGVRVFICFHDGADEMFVAKSFFHVLADE